MKQLTKNQLKILAMVCMTLDHIGAAFFPQAVWLRVIGRLAFPLFSYCIAEGCRYTRNKARYFGSVFACGAVCVIAFLPFGSFYGNALITLSMSILLLYGMEAWESSGKLRFLALTAALAAGHRRAARFCDRSAGACRCDGRLAALLRAGDLPDFAAWQ